MYSKNLRTTTRRPMYRVWSKKVVLSNIRQVMALLSFSSSAGYDHLDVHVSFRSGGEAMGD